MIRALRCDQPSFKTIDFTPGLNVILAERTRESTKKGSRNGLGKTTFVEIVHFLLGSRAAGNPLLREPLKDWTFTLDLELNGKDYAVHRSTGSPQRVNIEGDFSNWPVSPHFDAKDSQQYVTLNEWTRLLGWLMFDLRQVPKEETYTPTFRSLISYFARKDTGAFNSPFQHVSQQKGWQTQVDNSFLLGLEWRYAQRWQRLKDEGNTLKELKKAIKAGLMSDLVGSVGDLEATKVRIEEQIALAREQLTSFRVHPTYHQIEVSANDLTKEIHRLTNDNVSDRAMVEFYESSFQRDQPASVDRVAGAYAEIGRVLPNHVVKRLSEVQEFHKRILENREELLRSEIVRINQAVAERAERIDAATLDRAQLMEILKTHGALEEYTALQRLLLDQESSLDEVKTWIANLKRFEQGESSLKIEKERLLVEARGDYEERQTIRQRAISLFNANSQALYDVPGKLIIDVKPDGYSFTVDIERSDSHGISKMKLFCYDLMLAQLWSSRAASPGFLIHDSQMFDGVDERQIAHALQLADESARTYGFQYICCLNSDMVPWSEFEERFNLHDYVRVQLTDDRPEGSLLGIRF